MEGAKAGVAKPELVHKLEGCTDEVGNNLLKTPSPPFFCFQVNGAVLIPGEQGVISISR